MYRSPVGDGHIVRHYNVQGNHEDHRGLEIIAMRNLTINTKNIDGISYKAQLDAGVDTSIIHKMCLTL